MNNLEHLKYSEVVHASAVPYSVWRKQLTPAYAIVWRDLALGYISIALILFLCSLVSHTQPLLFLVTIFTGAVLVGFLLAFLALFIHEAGHFNLHSEKKKNDLLANIFLGTLFGVSIKAYRKIHWQHHLHLGTPEDTETSYFRALTPSFFVETFTGVYLLKIIFRKSGHNFLTPEMKKGGLRMLIASALFNLMLLAFFAILQLWSAAAVWILGMLVFFPFFSTIRQLLEHRSEHAERKDDFTRQAHGKISRLFSSDLFSRIFGGAGFNRHMIHHWDAQISYTRLDDVVRFLSECDNTKHIISTSRTSYYKTLRKLLRK